MYMHSVYAPIPSGLNSTTYNFYTTLLLGARDVLFQYEENRCSMTYMFDYPEYLRIKLPKKISRRYPAYELYLYGEGISAEENRNLILTGIPILFLPGNAGSFKQVRSLGSIALRKAEDMDFKYHFDVFSVNFNEELVALYGGSLQKQTRFVHECIKIILKLYKGHEFAPRSVAVVGHSMGGLVARALVILKHFKPELLNILITQATPHVAPVLPLDQYLADFYSTVNHNWIQKAQEIKNLTTLSVAGGFRDYQVRSGLAFLPSSSSQNCALSVVSSAVPRVWASTDHLSIVWCKELNLATVRAFFDLIDDNTKQITENPQRKNLVLNHHFLRYPGKLFEERLESLTETVQLPVTHLFTFGRFNLLHLTYGLILDHLTEISAKLHIAQPENDSTVPLLKMYSSSDCQYEVTVKTSFLQVLGQVIRLHGGTLPMYIISNILLAYRRQLRSLVSTGQCSDFVPALTKAAKPYKVEPIAYMIKFLLGLNWFKALRNSEFDRVTVNNQDLWFPFVSLILFMFGTGIAYWGGVLLDSSIRLLSSLHLVLTRPSGLPSHNSLITRLRFCVAVSMFFLSWTTCGALAIMMTYFHYIFKLLGRKTGGRNLPLSPRMNSCRSEDCSSKARNSSSTTMANDSIIDSLKMHVTVINLMTWIVLLSCPSLIYWLKNIRYHIRLDPDPCRFVAVVLIVILGILMNTSTTKLKSRYFSYLCLKLYCIEHSCIKLFSLLIVHK
uniref:GPI inositol-deacylase n=1 Tax=Naja naja TaxID=35670 RepID=A0A8C6XAH8_NAJNA